MRTLILALTLIGCGGLTDCSDPTCTDTPECAFGRCSLEICDNGIDDDCP